MSILTDIFTADGADEAQAGTSQPTDDAQIAPPPPDLPGDDGGTATTSGGVEMVDDGKAPDMLMPGGPMDPAA